MIAVAETRACSHCGEAVPPGLLRHGEALQFCCSGCRTVYETLDSLGLDEQYYALRGEFGGAGNTRATGRSFAAFDRDAFLDEHVSVASGTSNVDFLLEGVHCAACVWLVERLPRVVPGVRESKLRLRESRVTIRFDADVVRPSEIAAALDRLGYPPHPPQKDAADEMRRAQERRRLIDIGVAAVCAGNAMLVAFALYSGADDTFGSKRLFEIVGLALGWLAILWPGRTFLRGALAAIRTRTGHLDLPIAIALLAGGLGGTWSTWTGAGEAYFDSLTALVFLLLVGRYVQARQQRWASDAVDLTRALTPATCRVVRAEDGREWIEEVTTPELEVGAVVTVRPGEPFPADGVIESGRTTVDRSLLSGEAVPVPAQPGDDVFGGSVNVGAEVRARITDLGERSRIGRMANLVRDGLDAKPRIQRFTDRIAVRFVGVVCTLAAVTFAVWVLRADVATALDHTVALLIVACPCALGLATPLTLAVAVGAAARAGILVKDASVLERLERRARLVLDKTGTLTFGAPRVHEFLGDAASRGPVAMLESHSNHPLAQSMARDLASDADPNAGPVTDVIENLDGGISGMVGNDRYRVGSLRHLARHGALPTADDEATLEMLRSRGRSIVGVSRNDEGIVALVGLSDAVREDAAASLVELSAKGWQPEILSGDEPAAVGRVADELDIDDYRGGVDPEGKLARVRELREGGGDQVIMVGDGVNDAAALAASDVGIAVHGGAEASLAAADVYTSRPGLAPLVALRSLSRRTMRTIRINLAVSLTYNLAGVTLAALGYVDPLVAAVLMPASSVTVLSIALAPWLLGRGRR